MKSKILLQTHDAQMTALKITPKCDRTRISFKLKLYDETEKQIVAKEIVFTDVAAIEFRLNYFDNPIGAEVCGFYEIFDRAEKEKLLESNFAARKDEFLYHGDYDYDANEPSDILNYREPINKALKSLDEYHLYSQQTTGGFYLILSGAWKIQ